MSETQKRSRVHQRCPPPGQPTAEERSRLSRSGCLPCAPSHRNFSREPAAASPRRTPRAPRVPDHEPM